MPTQALNRRKGLSAEYVQLGPEELIRLLVDQLTTSGACGPPIQPGATPSPEEIIFDIDLDGARYLLVRLPITNRPRVQLSPREQEIVRMVAQGHPNKIIADVLSISSWTVCTHMRRIFAKLGVGSRAAMVAQLLENRGLREQMTRCKPLTARSSTAARTPLQPLPKAQAGSSLSDPPNSLTKIPSGQGRRAKSIGEQKS